MGYKQERLEKSIEREIGRIIMSEVKDNRLKFVTITKVSLTNDYSLATVLYRVLGTDNQVQSTTKALNDAVGFIKTQLSKVLKIRKLPELHFRYDTSIEYGDRIEKILKDIEEQ